MVEMKNIGVYQQSFTRRRHLILEEGIVAYDDGRKEQFDHNFYLQGYARDEWLAALRECGFEVKAEYKNREKEPWSEGDDHWIVETVKIPVIKKLEDKTNG